MKKFSINSLNRWKSCIHAQYANVIDEIPMFQRIVYILLAAPGTTKRQTNFECSFWFDWISFLTVLCANDHFSPSKTGKAKIEVEFNKVTAWDRESLSTVVMTDRNALPAYNWWYVLLPLYGVCQCQLPLFCPFALVNYLAVINVNRYVNFRFIHIYVCWMVGWLVGWLAS